MLAILANEPDIEPTVIKKASQIVPFNFVNFQLLDIKNALGGAKGLDFLFKAYKPNDTEKFFPCEWFDSTEKLSKRKLPPYDSFFNILRNINPLQKITTTLKTLFKVVFLGSRR